MCKELETAVRELVDKWEELWVIQGMYLEFDALFEKVKASLPEVTNDESSS